MLAARSHRVVLVIAALAALFAASFAFASARAAHHHGMSVWFSEETIGDGDDVEGDVDIFFGSVSCTDGGHIEGNVHKFFGEFAADDGCVVDGRVTSAFDEGSLVPATPWVGQLNDDFSAQNRAVYKKIGWDVVVLFAFLLFPVRVRIALDRVEKHPGLSAGAGTIAVLAALPVAVMLMITVIGIPVIVLEFAALLACLWIGWAAVALVIGRRLLELVRPHAPPSPLAALVAGLIVVTAAQTLPLVGWAVTSLMILISLGAALLGFVRETSFHSFTGASRLPEPGPPMNRPL
ncbi:MAG: hypothetical protein IAI49_16880 [Candidatus Eremiobacteraeota bacterium]|nr:hypothetical protein [Candidatus Eremiobacteraeota bacterium]